MIEQLLPLSEKKIKILMYLYENDSSYLRKMSSELKIHPYQTKKIIDSFVLNKLLEQKKVGKTILLTINLLSDSVEQMIYLIECYKQKTENKVLKNIIKNLSLFSKNKEILSCCIFGSYARSAETKESDIDILFIVKNKIIEADIARKISQLSSLVHIKCSPIIMEEREFLKAIEIKDPAMISLIKPRQRIIVFGIEYFLRWAVF